MFFLSLALIQREPFARFAKRVVIAPLIYLGVGKRPWRVRVVSIHRFTFPMMLIYGVPFGVPPAHFCRLALPSLKRWRADMRPNGMARLRGDALRHGVGLDVHLPLGASRTHGAETRKGNALSAFRLVAVVRGVCGLLPGIAGAAEVLSRSALRRCVPDSGGG